MKFIGKIRTLMWCLGCSGLSFGPLLIGLNFSWYISSRGTATKCYVEITYLDCIVMWSLSRSMQCSLKLISNGEFEPFPRLDAIMINSTAEVLTSRNQECQVMLVLKLTQIRHEIHWRIEIDRRLPLSSHKKEDSMVVLPDHWPLTIEIFLT